MKNIITILILLISITANAQFPISQTGYMNLNGKQFGFSNGTDTVGKLYIDRLKLFKPLVLPTYATGAEVTSILNSIGMHSDSTNNALFYIDNAGGVHNFGSLGGGASGVTAVSAGLGMSFSTITATGPVKLDTSYALTQGTTQAPSGNKTFTGVINLNGGGNAYIQSGNSFGATATFGTKDNNQMNMISNNNIVASFFPGGQLLVGNGGTAPSQKLYVSGSARFDGTITTGANSGFSVLSGFNFSSFAANNASNNTGFLWGMNNTYSSGTKSFMTFGGDASLSSGTSSVIQLNMNPVYNSSGSGTYTLRGIYYNPTLTSMTNSTNIAYENTTGDVRFNTTSGIATYYGLAKYNANIAANYDTRTLVDKNYVDSSIANGTVRLAYTAVGATQAVNTSAETSIAGSGTGALAIAANALIVGKTYRFKISGIYNTTTVPGNCTFKIKLGSVTIGTGTINNLVSLAGNLYWACTGTIVCWTTGSGGTTICDGAMTYSAGNLAPPDILSLDNAGAVSTINTTISNTLDFTVQWVTANASNAWKANVFTLEALN